MKIFPLTALAVACAIFGCNTSATDNTPLEASRDQRIQNLAQEACYRYEACNGYGTGKKYLTADACRQDYNTKTAEAWPVDQCSNGRINNNNYSACVESVKQVACTGDVWDLIVAAGKCTSDKVCTDAPH